MFGVVRTDLGFLGVLRYSRGLGFGQRFYNGITLETQKGRAEIRVEQMFWFSDIPLEAVC